MAGIVATKNRIYRKECPCRQQPDKMPPLTGKTELGEQMIGQVTAKTLFCGISLLLACAASATNVRVATYNVDCSDTGSNNSLLGVARVVQGMGNHHITGNAQAVDVLALQELLDTNDNTITSTSLPTLVSQLNALYGAGVYAYDHTPDPTTGGAMFNGPSGLVYNTRTMKVISATPLGYNGDSFNGIFRAPMRYQLRPAGYGPSADFYVYVSHYKSGSGFSNDINR